MCSTRRPISFTDGCRRENGSFLARQWNGGEPNGAAPIQVKCSAHLAALATGCGCGRRGSIFRTQGSERLTSLSTKGFLRTAFTGPTKAIPGRNRCQANGGRLY